MHESLLVIKCDLHICDLHIEFCNLWFKSWGKLFQFLLMFSFLLGQLPLESASWELGWVIKRALQGLIWLSQLQVRVVLELDHLESQMLKLFPRNLILLAVLCLAGVLQFSHWSLWMIYSVDELLHSDLMCLSLKDEPLECLEGVERAELVLSLSVSLGPDDVGCTTIKKPSHSGSDLILF